MRHVINYIDLSTEMADRLQLLAFFVEPAERTEMAHRFGVFALLPAIRFKLLTCSG
jgi:hypothetical protein